MLVLVNIPSLSIELSLMFSAYLFCAFVMLHGVRIVDGRYEDSLWEIFLKCEYEIFFVLNTCIWYWGYSSNFIYACDIMRCLVLGFMEENKKKRKLKERSFVFCWTKKNEKKMNRSSKKNQFFCVVNKWKVFK